METALIIGRFQPLHKGHLHALKQAKENYNLIIGIGSSNAERTPDNPLNYDERENVLHNCLPHTEIVPLPDFNDDEAWLDNLENNLDFDLVISGNDYVRKLIISRNHPVKHPSFLQRERYSGTRVRQRIVDGKNWKHLVPTCAIHLLREYSFQERVINVQENDG